MWSVVGHEWTVRMLQHCVSQNRIGHAYLLTGPAQIGKTTLATNFAQALNCTSAEQPCGECTSCRKIAAGNHPDVQLIAGANGSIKIEQIRQLQSVVALSPHEAPWRVCILLDMDQATPEAANCLLKTLEEPPGRVVLILTAVSSHALLPTLVSRCQHLPLRTLSNDTITQALCHTWQVEPDQARLLARWSGGRIGWAIAALQDNSLLDHRAQLLTALLRALPANRFERMRSAEQLSMHKDDIPAALEVWQSWWRDLLLVKLGREAAVVNTDQLDNLRIWEGRYNTEQVLGFLTELLKAARVLAQDANARLALEVLFLKLPPVV